MKYRCIVCGYIYDDEKEDIPFAELPDDWVCPMCGTSKENFELIEEEKKEEIKEENKEIDYDLEELSIGQLSSLCSNLARGCEKQYKLEEAGMYRELANYFLSITPKSEESDIDDLIKKLDLDIEKNYKDANNIAKENGDRGTLRICNWGEKVTRMLNSILLKYKKDGDKMFEGKKIWICTVCGFIYIGETAPNKCPVCRVNSSKFVEVNGRLDV